MGWRAAVEDLYDRGMVVYHQSIAVMPSHVVMAVSTATFTFLYLSMRKARKILEEIETMMSRRSKQTQHAFPELLQLIEMLEDIETMMDRRSKHVQQAVPQLFQSDDRTT